MGRLLVAALAWAVRGLAGMEGVLLLLRYLPPPFSVLILRKYGARVGRNVRIYPPLLVHNAESDFQNLEIGDDSHLGREVFLDLRAPIRIGNRVTISMRSTILTHRDVGDSRIGERYPIVIAPVIIGDDAYLGAASLILHGVTVGTGAIVGAGAVALADVPDGSVVVGVPARARGSRDPARSSVEG